MEKIRLVAFDLHDAQVGRQIRATKDAKLFYCYTQFTNDRYAAAFGC
jgi:hypothetical protein